MAPCQHFLYLCLFSDNGLLTNTRQVHQCVQGHIDYAAILMTLLTQDYVFEFLEEYIQYKCETYYLCPTGEAEEHLFLHLLPVHQCWQSAVHSHHTHP